MMNSRNGCVGGNSEKRYHNSTRNGGTSMFLHVTECVSGGSAKDGGSVTSASSASGTTVSAHAAAPSERSTMNLYVLPGIGRNGAENTCPMDPSSKVITESCHSWTVLLSSSVDVTTASNSSDSVPPMSRRKGITRTNCVS